MQWRRRRANGLDHGKNGRILLGQRCGEVGAATGPNFIVRAAATVAEALHKIALEQTGSAAAAPLSASGPAICWKAAAAVLVPRLLCR